MGKGRAMAEAVSQVFHCRGSGALPGQSVWDLWWTERHWDSFFFEFLGVSLTISFHHGSACSYNTWVMYN
jgi:hypothetical protein